MTDLIQQLDEIYARIDDELRAYSRAKGRARNSREDVAAERHRLEADRLTEKAHEIVRQLTSLAA